MLKRIAPQTKRESEQPRLEGREHKEARVVRNNMALYKKRGVIVRVEERRARWKEERGKEKKRMRSRGSEDVMIRGSKENILYMVYSLTRGEKEEGEA